MEITPTKNTSTELKRRNATNPFGAIGSKTYESPTNNNLTPHRGLGISFDIYSSNYVPGNLFGNDEQSGNEKQSAGKRRKRSRKGGKWSRKYKRSINCRRPKGFSQKQHCKYGRRSRRR